MKVETKLLATPQDIKPTVPSFRVRGILNPAGVRLPGGKIMLLARIAETPRHGEKYFLAPRFVGNGESRIVVDRILRHRGMVTPDSFVMEDNIMRLPTISHFRKILLDESGMNVERISQSPDFIGRTEDGDFGVEDPRITPLKGRGYAMAYVSVSRSSGVSASLAVSHDLAKWDRKGVIFRQQNKDVVIFPEKFNGCYVALNRPEGTMIFDKPSIWLSYSKDLEFWGRDKPVMGPRKNCWDSLRIGAGTVPLKTGEGWLMIYHGVKFSKPNNPDAGKVYSAGAVLFHPSDPSRILARTPAAEPLFAPEHEFEMKGFVNKVVFPTAAIPDRDKKSLLVYCGASDSNIEVKKLRTGEILNSLEWK
ncbi:4-O-beta-D-mannosyl-D-glucose phosphorylase [uncultured archaeon]|nr:4-O-beta-D-mannosyl-D-glucose phosphorylase [uncultured archaeon]